MKASLGTPEQPQLLLGLSEASWRGSEVEKGQLA